MNRGKKEKEERKIHKNKESSATNMCGWMDAKTMNMAVITE